MDKNEVTQQVNIKLRVVSVTVLVESENGQYHVFVSIKII